MIRAKVGRKESEEKHFVIWNAFIDLIGGHEYEDVSEVQRLPHLVFWYDSEVNNGGHLQFFANRSGRHAKETIGALMKMQMTCQHKILEEACQREFKHPAGKIREVVDFLRRADKGDFSDLDQRYYRCEKNSVEYMREYLQQNLDEFIEFGE